jgi:hypothetical protein
MAARARLPGVSLKVAFVARDPALRLAGAKALEGAPPEWAIELVADPPPDADVVVCGSDAPGCVGIPFDPDEEPGALLESIAAAGRSARVIAVMSACGGCGVTTIGLHLARCYASCIVECGTGAGLAERLGLERAALKTWDPDDLSEESIALAALPLAGGCRAIVAPSIDPAGIDRVVEDAKTRFEVVVLDVPFGTELSIDCDVVVAVMPATMPGALRTRALLEEIRSGGTIAVVANRLGTGGESTRDRLARLLGDAITLELPACAAVRDAEDDGCLVPVRHRWSRRVQRLANGLRRRTGAAA